jgi:hypothetical protein
MNAGGDSIAQRSILKRVRSAARRLSRLYTYARERVLDRGVAGLSCMTLLVILDSIQDPCRR